MLLNRAGQPDEIRDPHFRRHLRQEPRINKITFYVIHFRAYDQYSKTNPTYAQYYYLFIYLFCLSSPRHVSASNYATIKGGYIKITQDVHECDYKMLKPLKC
jgi:hypothetical protein